jgi:hypothetical protein
MSKELISKYVQDNRKDIIKNSILGAAILFIVIYITGLFNYNIGLEQISKTTAIVIILFCAAVSALISYIITTSIKSTKIAMLTSFIIATVIYRMVYFNFNIGSIDFKIITLSASWFFVWSKLLFIYIYTKL